MKYLYIIVLPGILFLAGCGSTPPLSEAAILATADAIRARTPSAPIDDQNEAKAEVDKYYDEHAARADMWADAEAGYQEDVRREQEQEAKASAT